jgi:hypothetical protein
VAGLTTLVLAALSSTAVIADGVQTSSELPLVAVWVPSPLRTYPMHGDVEVRWTVRSGGAPLTSVSASAPCGGSLDTSTPGWQSFVVSATDAFGRTVEIDVRYRVDFDAGLLGPVGGGAPWPPEVNLSGIPPSGDILITDANGDTVHAPGSTVTLIEIRVAEDRTGLIVWNVWPLGYNEEAEVHTYDVPIEAYGPGDYELWFGYTDGETYRARLQRDPLAF